MTLVEFLLARIAEDEEVARACDPLMHWPKNADELPVDADVPVARASLLHSRRWDPARVLVECDAKRQIVALEAEWLEVMSATLAKLRRALPSVRSDSLTLSLLALPYADHPDYQQEWRP